MPKIKYKEIRFKTATVALIHKCNAILRKYNAAGYDMTLRQLYYQLVAADEIPNKQTEYDKLGSVVNDARLAGMIDWSHIVDRTRNLKALPHWSSPEDIISVVADQYRIDKWATQSYRAEVWIEKEALAGVFERICNTLDVPYFSCRGYTSQSEMWSAAQRLRSYTKNKQTPVILHFGDHDPSGMDMTRDVIDRLEMFTGNTLDVRRLALNMDQIEQYQPPPNPAKLSDSRAVAYIEQYGDESWELDALEPDALAGLVRGAIESVIDRDAWNTARADETNQRLTLQAISENFDDVEDAMQPHVDHLKDAHNKDKPDDDE